MNITKNQLVRIYSDRTEDVKIDELNKLLENGEWYIRDVIMYENCADYVLEVRLHTRVKDKQRKMPCDE